MIHEILPGAGELPTATPAIIRGRESWSYEQTAERCRALADKLFQRLGKRDAVVGILIHDPAHRTIALLGTWLAGMTAVVIEPTDPLRRRENIATHAGADLFVVDAATVSTTSGPGTSWIEFDDVDAHPTGSYRDTEIVLNRPALLAYIPGPSGLPRAVVRTHRDLLSDLRVAAELITLDDPIPARVAAPVSPMHGLVVALAALSRRLTLCPYSTIHTEHERIRDQEITVLAAPTSELRRLMNAVNGERIMPGCHRVIVNGDKLLNRDVENFRRLFSTDCSVVNSYGTTEAGFIANHVIDPSTPVPDLIPAGTVVDGKTVRILHREGREMRPGRRGEIVVLGKSLPPGFWNDPDSTSTVYRTAPEDPDMRMCDSGDVGYIVDDQLIVVGRVDTLVKIQDHRVDLGEAELAIKQIDGVQNSTVMVSEDSTGNRDLTAYVTPLPDRVLHEDLLRSELGTVLPHYMVPKHIVVIGERQNRSDADAGSPGASPPDRDEAPVSDTEVKVAEVWKEVFELDSVAVNDDILELGIGSLHAMVMCQKLCQLFSIEIPYSQLIISPTVRELSAYIDEHKS